MEFMPELIAEKKASKEKEASRKAEADAIARAKVIEMNRFDDPRDDVLYKIPLLAPALFKPMKKHKT